MYFHRVMAKRERDSSSGEEPAQKRVKTEELCQLCDKSDETRQCDKCKKRACESCIADKFSDRLRGVEIPDGAVCSSCVGDLRIVKCARCIGWTVMWRDEVERSMAFCSCPGELHCPPCLLEALREGLQYEIDLCSQCTRTCPRCKNDKKKFAECDECGQFACYDCSTFFRVGARHYCFCSEDCDDKHMDDFEYECERVYLRDDLKREAENVLLFTIQDLARELCK